MRPAIQPLFLPLAFALLAGLACAPPERPPDLHLISVETLRADAVDGGPAAASTPTLDALRARGTSFAETITPMPRTTPALGSLVTGLWPHHHGSREVGDPVTAGTSLAEILHERGYYTVAVVTNPSAGRRQGLDRGFDRFVGGKELLERWGDRVRPGGPSTGPGEPELGWAEVVNREVLDLVAQAPTDRPLFVWVFYFDPHFSYVPPSPWRESVEAPLCWKIYERLHRAPEETGAVFYDHGGVARRAVDQCRALYRATISYTDHQIGRLLESLATLERPGEALTVFTSDHGESFGERGLYFEHGEHLHDANLHVPLVVAGPGVAAGRVDRGAASLVDVMPTLLSLLGVPEDERPPMDGLDLSAHLEPEGAPRPLATPRMTFAESASALWNAGFHHVLTGRAGGRVCLNGPRFSLCEETGTAPGVFHLYDHTEDPSFSRDLSALHPEVARDMAELRRHWSPESARSMAARTPRFKLVLTPRLDGGYAHALYDLRADPAEEADVAADHPEIADRMLRALKAWAREIPRAGREQRDRELEETLESLGYIG